MASESVTFREAAKLIRQGVNPEDVGDMPYIGLEHIEEGTLRLVAYSGEDEHRFRRNVNT